MLTWRMSLSGSTSSSSSNCELLRKMSRSKPAESRLPAHTLYRWLFLIRTGSVGVCVVYMPIDTQLGSCADTQRERGGSWSGLLTAGCLHPVYVMSSTPPSAASQRKLWSRDVPASLWLAGANPRLARTASSTVHFYWKLPRNKPAFKYSGHIWWALLT